MPNFLTTSKKEVQQDRSHDEALLDPSADIKLQGVSALCSHKGTGVVVKCLNDIG